ncbi:peptide/nickel transport system ATP-binding protein [Nocardioides zeae]|uniref:Peptide/nickel transport system ATP-binding protein n=1 Tax=Nocardioides zeae TaxID=1457234 RepID=A0ACC6IDY9_9ACTN|nr:ABC transporter ATP-binding protein [Nocardioides zeae]MDR6174179.1 peptide/nickel transport system ATP-binding protein [Nocardioides zeae]MDR6208986.1 peptide/nickel transport system ATP-binding protein [Nocardioides zeae]
MSEPARPLLELRDVSVTFTTDRGEKEVVHGADLELAAGETVAIVGESGSGKSTLTSTVNRLLASNGRVTHGSITFDGRDLLALSERDMSRLRGREIGLVPQDPMSNLDPLMPLGRQISEIFRLHGVARGKAARARAVELLDMVGIPDAERRYRQYPHEFSGGMRQRVLIAMALACKPKLLIADEPTSALDVTVQKVILDQLAELTSSMGTAVLLVTHDLALAAERADRVLVMNRGEVVESGSAREVLTNPTDDYTRRLIAAAPSLGSTSLVSPCPAAGDAARDNVIEVRDLAKVYPLRRGLLGRREDLTAAQDISFTVPRGGTVGIVGESGSGKSTTAKMLLLLEESTSGVIVFDGQAVTHASGAELASFRRRVQPVFQNPYASLDPRYTIGESVQEPLDVHRIGTKAERKARARSLLRQVALDEELVDRYPHELSGGQRQRVAIARALALGPEVVVLDEAVSALDVLVQAQILDLLVDLQRRLGLSYVFISHDLAVVRMLCHEIHVMKAGRIVESGTPEEIFAGPQQDYTRTLLAAIPGEHDGLAEDPLRPAAAPSPTTDAVARPDAAAARPVHRSSSSSGAPASPDDPIRTVQEIDR